MSGKGRRDNKPKTCPTYQAGLEDGRAEADERVRALREAAQRVCDEADPDWGDEGWIDYLVPFAHVAALRAALDATAEGAHKP